MKSSIQIDYHRCSRTIGKSRAWQAFLDLKLLSHKPLVEALSEESSVSCTVVVIGAVIFLPDAVYLACLFPRGNPFRTKASPPF